MRCFGNNVLDQIFYSDIKENSQQIEEFLEEENITITQNEFDVLVIYRFNSGHLSRDAINYLRQENRNKEDWENIWTGHQGRREACQTLFFEGDDEDEE